ncbi:MAG: hypothetical protein R3F43_16580 [bacterium]
MAIFNTRSRTVDGLCLLVPDEQAVDLINGVLARAQQKFPWFDLYGYFALPNELQLLMGVPGLREKSRVLAWVIREIAKRINRLRRRSGPLFTRNQAIQVTTLEFAVDRMRSIMGQGTARLLSRHPGDDVSACANPTLLQGRPIEGSFVRPNGQRARLRVRLDRLPGLGDLSPRAYRALMTELADSVAAEHRPRRKKAGLPVPDPEAVRRRDPNSRLGDSTERAAPLVYGPPEHIDEWRAHHAEVRAAYTTSSLAFQAWQADPTLPMLPWPPNTLPPAFAQRSLRPRPDSS